MTAAEVAYREVTDSNGRTYRIGESPEQIMGRSRAWMMWLPWIAMMGVSVFEYGYGAAASTIEKSHHWTLTQAFWLVAIWTVFQAGVAFPAGRLREKGVFSARAAMLAASVMVFLAFVMLGVSGNYVLNLFTYGVLGGGGCGLVYATCINMVGKWYPEKRGARTGFVNGGFAYGTLPFIFVFSYFFSPANYSMVLSLIAAYMLVVVGLSGLLFRDPPKNWWPAEVDPLQWASQTKSVRSLRKNPPAVRQFTPMEAIKTGQLPLMWLSLAFIGGVSLFGVGYQVPFAKSVGFGPFIAASSAGVLALVNGVGRALVGWLSDLIGRKQALLLVQLTSAIAQFGLIWSGKTHNEVLFIFFAMVAGVGSGAFFPMFAALTPDYFGENNNATNYGLIYSAKLVSGIVGFGAAASVVHSVGYFGAYTIAGCTAIVSLIIAAFLRQPGREQPLPGSLASSGNEATAHQAT